MEKETPNKDIVKINKRGASFPTSKASKRKHVSITPTSVKKKRHDTEINRIHMNKP